MSKNPWRIAKACRLQVLAKAENQRNWPEAGKSREAFWRLALRRRRRTSTTCHEENRRPGTAAACGKISGKNATGRHLSLLAACGGVCLTGRLNSKKLRRKRPGQPAWFRQFEPA